MITVNSCPVIPVTKYQWNVILFLIHVEEPWTHSLCLSCCHHCCLLIILIFSTWLMGSCKQNPGKVQTRCRCAAPVWKSFIRTMWEEFTGRMTIIDHVLMQHEWKTKPLQSFYEWNKDSFIQKRVCPIAPALHVITCEGCLWYWCLQYLQFQTAH